LPIVCNGIEWSLALREEHWLRKFENRALKKMIGPIGEKLKGDCRKLCSEELNDLPTLTNIIWVIKMKKDEMGGTYGMYGSIKKCM
jgi:hypothetical protein